MGRMRVIKQRIRRDIQKWNNLQNANVKMILRWKAVFNNKHLEQVGKEKEWQILQVSRWVEQGVELFQLEMLVS